MVDHGQYTLVCKDSNQLAFKLSQFTDLAQFTNVQRLNYYTLIWIQEGTGEIIADYNDYQYHPGHLFSFTPYQPFFIKPQTASKGYIIQFHSDYFCIHKHQEEVACNGVLFNNIYEDPYVEVDRSTSESLSMIVREIIKGIDQNEMAMNELVLSYLKLFLIHASRLRQHKMGVTDTQAPDKAFVPQKLKELIEAHFKEKHTPKEYADLLHITPKALGKISQKHFNKNLTTLIAERIIVEAKRELYLTSKTIKEIAFQLGYNDEYYFSRFFKKNTAVTPTMFRKTVGFAKGEQ